MLYCTVLRIFPRNLCRIKNNKKTELQEKLAIVTGLCAGREESQTQKFGVDHLRWEGGLATENTVKADKWNNGWKPIVVILFKLKHLVVTILWERNQLTDYIANWLTRKGYPKNTNKTEIKEKLTNERA